MTPPALTPPDGPLPGMTATGEPQADQSNDPIAERYDPSWWQALAGFRADVLTRQTASTQIVTMPKG
jgi:hypothetical protein